MLRPAIARPPQLSTHPPARAPFYTSGPGGRRRHGSVFFGLGQLSALLCCARLDCFIRYRWQRRTLLNRSSALPVRRLFFLGRERGHVHWLGHGQLTRPLVRLARCAYSTPDVRFWDPLVRRSGVGAFVLGLYFLESNNPSFSWPVQP